MGKFRKKPVVVEAVQFTDGDKNRVFHWITCNHYPSWDADGRPTIRIETLEGEHTASLGDWIIRGVKGEFYPCKPDIFALTYESLAENPKQPEENRAIIGQENPDNAEDGSARVSGGVCSGPMCGVCASEAASCDSEATGAAVLPAASVPAGAHLPDAVNEALKRSATLIQAACDLIKENHLLDFTAVWDEAECDGYCYLTDASVALDAIATALSSPRGGV